MLTRTGKVLVLIGLGVWMSSVAGVVAAHNTDSQADSAIRYRQGVFRAMEWNVSRMAAMAQGRVPYDAEDFNKRAQRLNGLSLMVQEGFPKGSETGEHVESFAKPDLWWEEARFSGLLGKLQQSSTKLAQMSAAGDERDDLRHQLAQVAQSCKRCHDDYRKDPF